METASIVRCTFLILSFTFIFIKGEDNALNQLLISGDSRQGKHANCASPEVLVNGSPSPDILDTVSGQKGSTFSSIEEIQFVGIIGPFEQKRICKIKCVNGVWVGPLCALQQGSPLEPPSFRECQIRPRSNGLIISYNGSQLTMDRIHTIADQSIIKIRCDEIGMYKFVGNAVLQCKDGRWNYPFPKCELTTMQTNYSQNSPPSIVYSVASGDVGVNDEGDVVLVKGSIAHFDCLYSRANGDPEWSWTMAQRQYPSGWAVNEDERNWKYRVSIYYANELDSGEFKCVTPKGHYNSIKVVVKDIECPPIVSTDVNRVMEIEGNKMHNKAKFSCVDGYYLEGIDETVCTSSGYWSYDAPLCKAIKCPTIKSDDLYLRISQYNRTYGSHVYFSCPNGYKLNGVSFMSCLKNNSWSAEVPACEEIMCPQPQPPINGRVLDSGRFRTGDYVQYFCNAGYTLVGEGLSICMENGNWSKPTPTCKATCEFPGEPNNGYITPTKFNYNIGESVTVVCNGNYRLYGIQYLKCNENGHWSSPLPNCRPFRVTK